MVTTPESSYMNFLILEDEHRRPVVVAGFNKAQARTALGILRHPDHREYGKRILACVDHLSQEGRLEGDITVSKRTAGGGLYVEPDAPLSWRCAKLVGEACVREENHPDGFRRLIQDLERIQSGIAAPTDFRRPYRVSSK